MLQCLSPNGLNALTTDAPPLKLAVATIDGVRLFERPHAGTPWQATAHTLTGCHVGALLYHRGTGVLMAGTHGQGLYRSTDLGATWQRVGADLPHQNFFTLACADRADHTVLYAAGEPVGLYSSTDGGLSWQALPAIAELPQKDNWRFPEPPFVPHVKYLNVDPIDHALYACVEQGALLKSTDGGHSWTELSAYELPDDSVFRDMHRLSISPHNHQELWLTSGTGTNHSLDGGLTWRRMTTDTFRVGYPDHFVISVRDAKTLFMAGAERHPGTWQAKFHAYGTVMRSRDGGLTWETADAGLLSDGRSNIEAMSAAHHAQGMTLFVGNTDGEVFTSEDEGTHWQRVGSVAPVSKSLHYVPLQPDAPRHHKPLPPPYGITPATPL